MTDIEARRAKQRESNRRWREKHPITDEERAKRRAYYKEHYAKDKKKEQGEETKSTARHPTADPVKRRQTPKEKAEKKKREIREDAEARAMGISYGKYQMLKQQGMLPRYIPIVQPEKPKKKGIYTPPERGLSEFNAARERMFTVAANRIMEERREKRARIRSGDNTVTNYMERMRRQKEAVERAATGSDQCDS